MDCKTCVENKGNKHSEEWSLSKELAKNNKRWFIIAMVILCMWLSTIGAFVWYLNQYDYSSYDVDQGGEWGNTFIGGVNEGDINYGAENTNETENTKESPQG